MMIKIENADECRSGDGHLSPQSIKLEAMLKLVNGRAITHTWVARGLFSVERVAVEAEKQLHSLGVPKRERAGAKYVAQSGSRLPNAYRGTAVATTATLLRRSSHWYLVDYERFDLWPGDTPQHTLVLTADQDARAVAELRRGYAVAAVAAAAAQS
jgi:hypothetical protein